MFWYVLLVGSGGPRDGLCKLCRLSVNSAGSTFGKRGLRRDGTVAVGLVESVDGTGSGIDGV